MILNSNEKMVFLGIETRQSQRTGNNYQLVVLGDPKNFENHQFFLTDDLNVNGLKNGDNVNPVFTMEKRGYNTTLQLVALNK